MWLHVRIYAPIKMAACSTRSRRFLDDSSGLNDSEQKSQRFQRKSTWKVTQEANDGQKKCAGSKSKKGAKGGGKKIEDGVGDKIGEEVVEGIDGGIDERVGEVIDKGIGEGLGGGSDNGVGEGVGRSESAEAITCLCDCKVEKGEMVCCDVCEGWSHLRCMGMKEGGGLMEGKVFVCYFCLSKCLVSLRNEVGVLREELSLVKSELKETRDENERLKSELEREGTESSRMASEGEVTGDMTDGGVVTYNKVDEMVVSGEGEKPVRCQQSSGVEEKVRQNDKRESRAESSRKEPKKLSKWAPGVRKVWGTCKKESMNDIAKEVSKTVGNLSSNFMVGRHVDQQNGKNVWWFTVKAPEKTLLELDKKWNHKHWRWLRVQGGGNDFLGAGPVSRRHR